MEIPCHIVDNKADQAYNPKQPFKRYKLYRISYTIDDIQLYFENNDVTSSLVVIQYLNRDNLS